MKKGLIIAVVAVVVIVIVVAVAGGSKGEKGSASNDAAETAAHLTDAEKEQLAAEERALQKVMAQETAEIEATGTSGVKSTKRR